MQLANMVIWGGTGQDAGSGRSDWSDIYVGWMSHQIAVVLGGFEGAMRQRGRCHLEEGIVSRCQLCPRPYQAQRPHSRAHIASWQLADSFLPHSYQSYYTRHPLPIWSTCPVPDKSSKGAGFYQFKEISNYRNLARV